MKYFCPRCDWEGDNPTVQFIEAPDTTFDSYVACPNCSFTVYETDTKHMRYNHWYQLGAYYVRWK